MLREAMAVDPDQHPVDQYRYDSEWADIMMYLALLYLHSKLPYYKKTGQSSTFNARMNIYRDLDAYSYDFMKMLEEVLKPNEYAKVRGQLQNAHAAIKARVYKPLWLRQAFKPLRDDVNHVHSPRIKNLLRPLMKYFQNGSQPMQAEETEVLAAMKRIRNPRVLKLVTQVEEDLPAMVSGGVEYKASKDDIRGMSKTELATLAVRTKDDYTLDRLFSVAREDSNRTLLGFLFQRGYIKGDAPYIYKQNKLATPGNFKKLKDEVLLKYLMNMPYTWREKFRGQARWRWLYEELLSPDKRQDLLFKLTEECIKSSRDFEYPSRLYAVAANHLPPSKMTPDMVSSVWRFAEDPQPLVHYLDKTTRKELYEKDYSSLLPSTWLFDFTKEELRVYIEKDWISETSTIDRVYGPGWGSILKRPIGDIDYFDVTQFFATLTQEGVDLLMARKQWMSNFVSDLRDDYKIMRHPGGRNAWFRGIFKAASRSAKTFLMGFVPAKFLEAVEDLTDDSLKGDLASRIDVLRKQNKEKIEGIVARAGGIEKVDRYLWEKVIRLVEPAKKVEVYLEWRKARLGYFSAWESIEAHVAETATPDSLIDFVDIERAYYDETPTKVALKRLPASAALQLVQAQTDIVRGWVADNYPASGLKNLVDSNPGYFPYICRFAARVPEEDITDLMAIVTADWPKDVYGKSKVIACLVLYTDAAAAGSYLDQDDPKVKSAAMVNATRARALRALKEDTDTPLFASATKRPDFGNDAEVFLREYLQNPKMDAQWNSDWIRDIYLDEAVPRMTDKGFVASLENVNVQLNSGPRPVQTIGVWGIHAYMKATLLEAAGGYDINWSAFKERFELAKSPTFIKAVKLRSAYSGEELQQLVEHGPWADTNLVIRKRMGVVYKKDKKWVASLSDDQLKWYIFNLDYKHRWTYSIALKEAKERRVFEAKGSLLEQLEAAYNTKDYPAVAHVMAEGLKQNVKATQDLLERMYKSDEKDLQIQLIMEGSKEVLDEIRNIGVAEQELVIHYASEKYLEARFKTIVEDSFRRHVENFPRELNIAARKDTRLKAAMIDRATPEQALELFKFFYKEQQEFGPKVRDAFLDKMNDLDFAKLLKAFLLSREYNLRIKKFTLEMLPVVLKFDDPDLTDKFNRSRLFREKAIGGLKNHWDGLKTVQDKEDFLDTLDRGMMERLLRSLVEVDISLSAPLTDEFVLGSNDTARTGTFLSRFSKSTRTITHRELFNLSVDHASDADIYDWILHNPHMVWGYNKAAPTATTSTIRVDWIDDKVNAKITEDFKNAWDHSAHRSFYGKVERAYAVVTPRTPKRVERNIKILYHGTDYFAAGCIIQDGFKIMSSRKAGRMLGNGIYFADVSSKACQYLGQKFNRSEGRGVCFVCEVDLGNMLTLSSSTRHLETTWMNHGYDSVYWPKNKYGYGGKNTEFCVKDVNRIKILYVLDIVKDRR